jgi:hypothetical protein
LETVDFLPIIVMMMADNPLRNDVLAYGGQYFYLPFLSDLLSDDNLRPPFLFFYLLVPRFLVSC